MTPLPDTRLARLGSWSFTHRRRVFAGWLIALVAAIAVLMPLAGDYNAEFTTPNSDSEKADAVLTERFTDRSSSSLDVVWHAGQGAQAPEVKQRIDAMLADASQLEGISGVTPAEVSRDGQTAIARLQIAGDEALVIDEDVCRPAVTDQRKAACRFLRTDRSRLRARAGRGNRHI
jgi:RND superfamily putative drug exporter